jgi:hypothetical protein
METIAGLGMETAVGVGETAVGESVGTVGAETMAEFSSAFGETMSASVDSLSGYGTDLSGYDAIDTTSISNPVVTAALPPATVYRINSSFAVNSDTAPFGVSAE